MKLWVEKGIRKYKNADAASANINLAEVKNILVIRHSALGDMIQTRPFLYELRKLFPNAKIKLSLISNYTIGAPSDLVDEVEVLPGRDQRDYSFIKLLQSYRSAHEFDLLFDLASTTRSRIQTFLTKAKLKLGYPYRNIPFLYHFAFFRSEFRYETELLLEFLNLFGHVPEYPLNFKLDFKTWHEREKIFAYFPSSSMSHRNYPMQWFQQLMELNAKEYADFDHYIIEGANVGEDFLELRQNLSYLKNVKFRPKTKIDELGVWLSNARYLITNDTGVRHLAMAYSTPTLGFFTTSIPFRNYNPHDKNHLCVFNPDGSYPTPDIVLTKIKNHLNKISSSN